MQNSSALCSLKQFFHVLLTCSLQYEVELYVILLCSRYCPNIFFLSIILSEMRFNCYASLVWWFLCNLEHNFLCCSHICLHIVPKHWFLYLSSTGQMVDIHLFRLQIFFQLVTLQCGNWGRERAVFSLVNWFILLEGPQLHSCAPDVG